jgi:hypothetical protein
MEYLQEKIKIKYILGTYKDSPVYPTGEDILYIMIKRVADRGEDLSDITFTTTKLFKKLGDVNEQNVKNALVDLVATGYAEVVRETKDSQTYKILINNYI